MKAWQLDRLGGRLRLADIPVPAVRPASVLVRVEASVLMTYLRAYVEGRLHAYHPPQIEFTLGETASAPSPRSEETCGT